MTRAGTSLPVRQQVLFGLIELRITKQSTATADAACVCGVKLKLMIELSWLSVAEEQLEVAIILYRSGNYYCSAITLAGAAEEILGRELSENLGRQNAVEPMVGQLSSSFTAEELAEVGGNRGVRYKLNEMRNFLKHRKEYDITEADVKSEAWEMIQRAVCNYLLVTGKNEGLAYEFQFEPDPTTT